MTRVRHYLQNARDTLSDSTKCAAYRVSRQRVQDGFQGIVSRFNMEEARLQLDHGNYNHEWNRNYLKFQRRTYDYMSALSLYPACHLKLLEFQSSTTNQDKDEGNEEEEEEKNKPHTTNTTTNPSSSSSRHRKPQHDHPQSPSHEQKRSAATNFPVSGNTMPDKAEATTQRRKRC